MKARIVNVKELLNCITSNQTIMVGGFLKCGYPDELVKKLLVENDKSDFTVISNDTATNDSSFYQLIESGKVEKVYASYIGGNKATGKKFLDNEESVQLYPQGTLIEKIRCGGNGLGGILTKVGLGTVVEQGKTKVCLHGDEFLIEESLRADIALIYARQADKHGNLKMCGTEINFNSLMALAADTTIALVDEVVQTGEISPEEVTVPGIFTDYIVCRENLDG